MPRGCFALILFSTIAFRFSLYLIKVFMLRITLLITPISSLATRIESILTFLAKSMFKPSHDSGEQTPPAPSINI